MAEREAIVTIEERAAAIRAEAEILREKVPDAFRASNDAALNDSFERASPADTPNSSVVEAEPSSPEAGRSSEPVTNSLDMTATDAADTPRVETSASMKTPPPVTATPPGADGDELDSDIGAVHDKAKEFERKTFFQQQAADENPNKIGAREQGAFAAKAGETVEDRKKKEEAKRFKQLIKLLDDYIGWLDREIDHWREQERAWEERGDAIAEALAKLDRGETIEVDENGMPTDQRLREAVEAYETQHGRKLDVNNKDDLLTLQRFQLDELAYARDQREQREHDRREAQELKEDLERDPHNPATLQRAEEMRRTAEGQMQLGKVVADSENRELRENLYTAATTTAQDQEIAEQVSATAEDYFSGGTDDGFEDDGFGGGTSFAKTTDPDYEAALELTPTFQVAAIGEAAPVPDNPEQRPDAAPLNIPSRFA